MKLSKKTIIFLLGPTASGKTDWAIDWQNQFEAFEIISVDSVMVYKECNVGSAKPSDATLANLFIHAIFVKTFNFFLKNPSKQQRKDYQGLFYVVFQDVLQNF